MKLRSAGETIALLRRNQFPFEELARHPVSSIEPLAVTGIGGSRGVCAVRCLACCAGAALPSSSGIVRLSPELLGRVLEFAGELAREDLHILSRVRLTLYNASNELDNPDCIQLRRLLSQHFDTNYGFPLGAISSDLAFHQSGSPMLQDNLSRLIEMPRLWDNICFSIDEQIPMHDEGEYASYLAAIDRTWSILKPALTCQLDHARVERHGAPRVILNMLVPEAGSGFQEPHRELYPGGPLRAVRFEELVDRYVSPFVGNIVGMNPVLPAGHKFTSAIGALSLLPGSSLYLAFNRYAPTGRGTRLVSYDYAARKVVPRAINTRLYPAAKNGFRFQASFTTAPFADDEVHVAADQRPKWFQKLNSQIIHTED